MTTNSFRRKLRLATALLAFERIRPQLQRELRIPEPFAVHIGGVSIRR